MEWTFLIALGTVCALVLAAVVWIAAGAAWCIPRYRATAQSFLRAYAYSTVLAVGGGILATCACLGVAEALVWVFRRVVHLEPPDPDGVLLVASLITIVAATATGGIWGWHRGLDVPSRKGKRGA